MTRSEFLGVVRIDRISEGRRSHYDMMTPDGEVIRYPSLQKAERAARTWFADRGFAPAHGYVKAWDGDWREWKVDVTERKKGEKP